MEGHPNITTFYDSWVEPAPSGGEYFLIRMELCGEKLSELVKKKTPMGESELLDLMRQVCM